MGTNELRRMAAGCLVAAPVALVGCGGGDDSHPRRPMLPIVVGPDAPASYAVADEGCLAGGAPTPFPLTKAHIHAWEGQKVVEKDVALTGITSGDSLTTNLVSTSTWRDDFERECDYAKPSGHECDGKDGQEQGWLKVGSGGNLRVCEDGKTYGRETYEGVGLTSLYYVTKAHARYQSLAETKKDLPQIMLSVLPNFVDYYDNYYENGQQKRRKTFITHNMAYFPSPPMIAVFPESEEERPRAKGFFWESEFVLTHEYSHHIDFSRNGGALSAMGLEWNGERHGFDDMVALAATGNPSTDRAQIQGSAAEGFADLLAYYGEGATSTSLVGLPCFGKNRDVATKTFENGDDKALTDDRFAMLLGHVRATRPECGEPGYHDIHTGGAILATTLDEVFARVDASLDGVVPGSPEDIDRRYKMALQWNQEFMAASKQLALAATGADVLQPVAVATERVVEKTLGSFRLKDDQTADGLQADVCKGVKARLPVLKTQPFGC